MKNKIGLAVAGLAAVASSAAMAQASGVDATATVAAVNSSGTAITAVCVAMLGIVSAVWGYKKVMGLLGR